MLKKINIWVVSSVFVSLIVAIPIITVFSSFFNITTDYFTLLKNTFLLTYIYNSIILLLGVLFLSAFFGITSAYLVSFFNFVIGKSVSGKSDSLGLSVTFSFVQVNLASLVQFSLPCTCVTDSMSSVFVSLFTIIKGRFSSMDQQNCHL